MKFPQDFIDRVREATNLVDIVGQFVQLRRTGGNHQGLCPFHNEKSPSFSVSEDKQVYYCFGCKESGNVIGFVQKFQGMTFPETIEYLAKRASIAMPAQSEGHTQAAQAKTTFFKINAIAAQFYHQQLLALPADHLVRKYCADRGLSEELIDAYKLGYAPDDWSTLTEFLATKRAPVIPTEQVGLIKRRTGGKDGHYDLFRHRLMFPIFSPTGDCLGFGGRVFSKEQQPKYLNSPDSPVFHKGKVFYGLDHSAKFIRTEDEAIVVEGYMDWLALAKYSIGNVVATLGTALTSDHARAIKKYTNKVLLLFDGDEAGKSAARRSLPILLSEGVLARGLFLPDQLDPDDFLKERGVTALRQLIQGAPDLFDLVSTEAWLQAKGSPTGKIQLLDDFAEILAVVPDARLRRLYGQNLANILDVELRMVEQSVAKVTVGARGASVPETPAAPVATQGPSVDKIDLSKAPPPVLELLNLMLMKEVYLKEALASGVGEFLQHPGCTAVFHRIAEVYGLLPNKFDTLSALLADQVTPVASITRHLSQALADLPDEDATKVLRDCIKRVKSKYLSSKSNELVKGLRGQGEAVPSDQLEQIMNIQKDRRSL